MQKGVKNKEERTKGRYNLYIEEMLLLYMLWSDISGFFGVIPADFEYVDKLIAWVVIALLLYRLSLTRILFGHKNPREDILLVVAFFLLVLKNNFTIIKELVSESVLLTPFFKFMLQNSIIIEKTAFYIGGLLLILLSVYTAKRLSIKKPSIMHLIHEEGMPPQSYTKQLVRFTTVFLVLISFFIIIFNLIIEWVGYLHDDSITILSIILGIVIINKHSKKLSDYTIFKKIDGFSEKFLQKIFEFLKTRRHIFVATSGILVLHLLTDFIVFIMPLFLGKTFVSYFGSLEANHPTIFKLAATDITQAAFIDKINLLYLYAMELVAILFLMLFPLYIWYLYYSGKGMRINDKVIALFFTSLMVFLLAPIFKLSNISKGYVLGVDIRLSPISFAAIVDIQYIVMASLLIFFITFLLIHYSEFFKKMFIYFIFLPLAFFMIRYVYFFLKDLAIFYLRSINKFLIGKDFFFLLYFFLFLIITLLFYICGTFYFLLEAERKLGYFANHFYQDNKVYKIIKNKKR